MSDKSGSPLYERVKLHVLQLIEDEAWGDERRLPSESDLVKTCNASRMTVNRALRELVAEGYIERIAGVGTFAAETKAASHPLDIRNIAEEIAERGHSHSCEVIALSHIRATAEIALQFSVAMDTRLFHSEILHFENGLPIQYESRYVLPEFAPDYDSVDFHEITTNQYLLSMSSRIEKSEQKIMAQLPPTAVAAALQIESGEYCLVLERRTWVKGRVVTYSQLFHPATRFQFESIYTP